MPPNNARPETTRKWEVAIIYFTLKQISYL